MRDDTAETTIDIRGVGCPMNYVKVSDRLEDIRSGGRLEIIVDGGGGLTGVSRSAKEDGHRVVKVIPCGEAYRLIIEKA